jgi:hypothetical protein
MAATRICEFTVLKQVTGHDGSPTEYDMDKAVPDRVEQQAAMRVFFDWPARPDGGQADPKTVHAFVTGNSAALGMLHDELPRVIEWVEFRPEGRPRAASPHTLSYRIADRGRRATAAHDAALEDVTPVLVRLGPAELATVDALITAGIVNSRSEGLRWALSRLRGTRPTPG